MIDAVSGAVGALLGDKCGRRGVEKSGHKLMRRYTSPRSLSAGLEPVAVAGDHAPGLAEVVFEREVLWHVEDFIRYLDVREPTQS